MLHRSRWPTARRIALSARWHGLWFPWQAPANVVELGCPLSRTCGVWGGSGECPVLMGLARAWWSTGLSWCGEVRRPHPNGHEASPFESPGVHDFARPLWSDLSGASQTVDPRRLHIARGVINKHALGADHLRPQITRACRRHAGSLRYPGDRRGCSRRLRLTGILEAVEEMFADLRPPDRAPRQEELRHRVERRPLTVFHTDPDRWRLFTLFGRDPLDLASGLARPPRSPMATILAMPLGPDASDTTAAS